MERKIRVIRKLLLVKGKKMKFCTQCGHEMKEESIFCANCGHKVNQNSSNETKGAQPSVHSQNIHPTITPNNQSRKETDNQLLNQVKNKLGSNDLKKIDKKIIIGIIAVVALLLGSIFFTAKNKISGTWVWSDEDVAVTTKVKRNNKVNLLIDLAEDEVQSISLDFKIKKYGNNTESYRLDSADGIKAIVTYSEDGIYGFDQSDIQDLLDDFIEYYDEEGKVSDIMTIKNNQIILSLSEQQLKNSEYRHILENVIEIGLDNGISFGKVGQNKLAMKLDGESIRLTKK